MDKDKRPWMDASELLARYAAGERDFCGVCFAQANLSEANLSEAILCPADLCEANLIGANLNGAILIGANLFGANLNGAILNGANLWGANLIGANLFKADLTNADLNEANLIGANLFEANLTNANLSGANIHGTILAYQKVSEELQRKNQQLIEQIKLLESHLIQQKSAQNLTKVSNQGINAPHEWKGFYFRSQAEIKIAEALDRAGVLFYPNSKARLNKEGVRTNKESDFLVFQAGKFGILEVDGREWHQTAADDHERDRLFKRYGIRVIERFDASRCWNEPNKVVEEFLEILSQA
jgi:hypothetical protein